MIVKESCAFERYKAGSYEFTIFTGHEHPCEEDITAVAQRLPWDGGDQILCQGNGGAAQILPGKRAISKAMFLSFDNTKAQYFYRSAISNSCPLNLHDPRIETRRSLLAGSDSFNNILGLRRGKDCSKKPLLHGPLMKSLPLSRLMHVFPILLSSPATSHFRCESSSRN
jgi:hypothetical protein